MKLTAAVFIIAVLFTCCTMRQPFPQKSGFVHSGQSMIYYEEGGTGEALLLLHAGFLNTEMWWHQVQSLSKHYRVIAIDLPGHGRTENDTIRIQPSDFIKTVLDSLSIEKASLVGVSLGASCVTDFIIAHPERVNKAVLVAAGVNGWNTRFKLDTLITQYLDSLFGALNKKDTVAAAEVFTKVWFDGPFRTPEQVNDTVRRYIFESTLANMKKHHVRGWPILAEPPAIENISSIKGPLLLIDGDKDMPYIGEATSFIQQNVKGSKRITIPGTGHMLNMENPDAFNKAVINFLKE